MMHISFGAVVKINNGSYISGYVGVLEQSEDNGTDLVVRQSCGSHNNIMAPYDPE